MRITQKMHRQDGAAAVEFALIVGVLAMLIFGMLQYGLAFFQLQNLRAATREGARAGAVGATVAQVKQATSSASLGALSASDPAINVQYWNGSTLVAGSCPPKDQQTTASQVRVSVNINNASAGLQNIFVVDIPMLPPISLKNANISGAFRCEGN